MRPTVRATVHESIGSSASKFVHETETVSVNKDGDTKVVANRHEVLDVRRPFKRAKISAPTEDDVERDDVSAMSDDDEEISQVSRRKSLTIAKLTCAGAWLCKVLIRSARPILRDP